MNRLQTLGSRVRKAAGLLLTEPKAFARVLHNRVQRPSTLVSQSIESALEAAVQSGCEEILVFGDRTLWQTAKAQLGDRAIDWGSDLFHENREGAIRPGALDFLRYDGILTGGARVKGHFVHLLRLMGLQGTALPVFWVGEQFEYAIGTLPIPAQVDDADVILFNHYEQFFGIKDPILARLEIFDQVTSRLEWHLFQPNETLRVNLKQMLPDRQGPACVAVHTVHPGLARGRHVRWRFWADLYWADSITAVHGLHDDREFAIRSRFRISRCDRGAGTFAITLPNYARNLTRESQRVRWGDLENAYEYQRSEHQRIDQLDAAVDGSSSGFDSFLEFESSAVGGSMWFALEDRLRNGEKANVSANHTVAVSGSQSPLSSEAPPLIGQLDFAGLVLQPHAIPVADGPVRFGFSFDNSAPVITAIRAFYFDHDGNLLGNRELRKDEAGPLYADDLCTTGAIDGIENAGLVMVAPDWAKMGMNPKACGLLADLYAQHRETLDFDVTEFQDSWRNVGIDVREYPHWIHRDKQLVGRTNLYGRVWFRDGFNTGLVLVNASGNLAYNTNALVTLKVFNAAGQAWTTELEVAAFTHRVIWVEDTHPELAQHLGSSPGAIVILSRDADLNLQMVTLKHDSAVSLQHLWGY